jgi:hypothetical protein
MKTLKIILLICFLSGGVFEANAQRRNKVVVHKGGAGRSKRTVIHHHNGNNKVVVVKRSNYRPKRMYVYHPYWRPKYLLG